MRILALFLFLGLLSVPLHAQDPMVSLKLPDSFAAKTCPLPVWKGASVAWKGVADRRERKEVGTQTKKDGKDPVSAYASPSLESVVNAAVSQLLKTCGLNLTESATTELSIEIREFHADVEKRLVTGKASTRSDFQLVFRENGAIVKTASVGYEIDEKSPRRRSIRQLEKALNELLVGTLEQLPRVEALKDL